MLKVGIVGCGKIADAHAELIQHMPNVEMVGVCDREELMARQLQERFPIRAYYTDIRDLLEQARPDVVHVTTPPQSHSISLACVSRTAATCMSKSRSLFARCRSGGAHSPCRTARTQSHRGERSLFLHTRRFVQGTVRQRIPWWRARAHGKLLLLRVIGQLRRSVDERQTTGCAGCPGNILHNIISHGIVRLAEYISDEYPTVVAHGFTSPFLRNLGEKEIIDELRVIVSVKDGRSAYFTFSSQMRPTLHQFRLYGPKNGLLLDDDKHAVIKLPGERTRATRKNYTSSEAGSAVSW